MMPLGHGGAEAGTVAGAGTDEGHRMERIDQYQFPGAMTSHQFKHASAISRRDASELCMNPSAQETKGAGKAGCPPHPRPRVRNKTKHTSVVTTGSPEHPAFPAQWFDGLLRALPGDQACLTPSSRGKSAKLDTSFGVPEPHGFTVRKKRRSSCTPQLAHEVHLALRLPCAPDAAASIASRTQRP